MFKMFNFLVRWGFSFFWSSDRKEISFGDEFPLEPARYEGEEIQVCSKLEFVTYKLSRKIKAMKGKRVRAAQVRILWNSAKRLTVFYFNRGILEEVITNAWYEHSLDRGCGPTWHETDEILTAEKREEIVHTIQEVLQGDVTLVTRVYLKAALEEIQSMEQEETKTVFNLTTLEIAVGKTSIEAISLEGIPEGNDVFDRLEEFIAAKLKETDIESVSPNTLIKVTIIGLMGDGEDVQRTPPAGYTGLAKTLEEVPPEMQGKITNRAQAAAFIAVEGLVKMVEHYATHTPRLERKERLGILLREELSTYKPEQGDTIAVVAAEMVRRADAYEIHVTCEFEGVYFTVAPKMSVEDVIQLWQGEHQRQSFI